jgi:serine/threonine protein phosphatase PrpC
LRFIILTFSSFFIFIAFAFFRSLGDSVAHTAGVSSLPEFTERELDPLTDKCIVVATDGLWEFVSNQETIDMVMAVKTPAASVEELVKEARSRWMAEEQVIDDTTVITASLFGYMNA